MSWAWSAAATKVLTTATARKDELVPLAYKELVVRQAVRLETRKRRWLPKTHRLTPSAHPVEVPRELQPLAQALRDWVSRGDELGRAVRRVAAKTSAHDQVVELTQVALIEAGLLTAEKRRLRSPRLHRTQAGVEAALAFSRLRDTEVPAVLLLGNRQLPEIDQAFRAFESAFDVDFSSFSSSVDGACHSADGGGAHDGGGGHH